MILRAANLSKSFFQGEQEIQVLHGLQLEVKKGERVAILGESGSGKSTLLSLIAGLDLPSSGQVLIEGEDLAKMNEDTLAKFRAKKIGIVFQQYHLISHLTALENVMLPLEISRDPHI
jgi:putative ABC transport system ATP-binding protein